MSFYSQYSGKSIGRQMHFIEYICGLQYAENVIFGGAQSIITYFDKPFAKVLKWEGEKEDIPVFEFFGPYKDDFMRNQETLRHDKKYWEYICTGKLNNWWNKSES